MKGQKKVLLDLATVYEATDPGTARQNATVFKTKYLDTPSTELLQLVHDAKIISDDQYQEEIYETASRRKQAA